MPPGPRYFATAALANQCADHNHKTCKCFRDYLYADKNLHSNSKLVFVLEGIEKPKYLLGGYSPEAHCLPALLARFKKLRSIKRRV